jgi:hypothetical protein
MYSVTVYKEPGIGAYFSWNTRGELLDHILRCLEANTPFTVGHIFGNIDGTRPKRTK